MKKLILSASALMLTALSLSAFADAGDAASDVGNAVGDTAQDAGNAVGDAAQGAGNAVGDAAQGTANAVTDVPLLQMEHNNEKIDFKYFRFNISWLSFC